MEHEGEGGGFLHALEMSGLGDAMRSSPTLYPAVETLHIIGFAILVGSIIAFDLRVLGFARGLPMFDAGQHLLPIAWVGFALAVPMGLMLFLTEATSIAANPAFRFKLVLLILAGLNMLLFHRAAWRHVHAWAAGEAPFVAKVSALASMVLWIGVLAGGRLIAYF